jgi:hypothetical protein
VKLFFLGTKYPIPGKIEAKPLRTCSTQQQAWPHQSLVFFNEAGSTTRESGDYWSGLTPHLHSWTISKYFARRVCWLVDLLGPDPIICNERDVVAR